MKCRYRNCTLEVPESSDFKMCDACRVLDNRDRVAIILDPTAPSRPAHSEHVIEVLITQMSGAETLRFHSNLEYLYLEMCKVKKLHSPEPTNRRVKLTLEEQIEEGRSAVEKRSIKNKIAKKSAKKKESVLDKQMNLLGCSIECRDNYNTGECPHAKEAKRIFNDDLGDL